MAALCAPDPEGGGGLLLNADGEAAKRTYPWGEPPAIQAHLGRLIDGREMMCVLSGLCGTTHKPPALDLL